jgi:hypothetical protein
MNYDILRIGAAVIIVWFAINGIEQKRPAPQPDHDVPANVDGDRIAAIAKALKQASAVDRALWAEVWEKASKVAAGDATASEVVFTDTKSLRMFTVICLDLAWHRIGGNEPGKYAGLRDAVESFLADPTVLGKDDVAVTPELRKAYVEATKAIAYAGLNRG